MVLLLGHFGQYIRNTWKVLKCEGEKWRRLDGPIVCEMEKYNLESSSRGMSYMK
jgi:hypothetical protein